MNVELIAHNYYGSNNAQIYLPQSMEPRADQFQGEFYDKLAEIAGRVCYDSFGIGRSSIEYHRHVQEVKHLSVYEHCVLTLAWPAPASDAEWLQLVNMPSIRAKMYDDDQLRLTLNLRHILEWPGGAPHWLHALGHAVAPYTFQHISLSDKLRRGVKEVILQPETDDELWISFLLTGSRGFSHEQVRHGDRTAISQRSTRYCDEGSSVYEIHPLLQQYLNDVDDPLGMMIADNEHQTKAVYSQVNAALTDYLAEKGIPRAIARKQARGAARGELCNRLSTQVVFSASYTQWLHMINLRMTNAADAEIRVIYNEIHRMLCNLIHELNSNRSDNDQFTTPPSFYRAYDGIGYVVR